jgi:hypothetical protein
MEHKLSLIVLSDLYAVCRLDHDARLPDWLPLNGSEALVSITRTADELSIVCAQEHIPATLEAHLEKGWRCLKVLGPLDFGLTGILSGLTGVLAAVGISIFALSTYDTDYLLVRQESLERAIRALRLDGHEVTA